MSTEFKKWFAARARNPDKITLEEAFKAGMFEQSRSPSAPDGWKEGVEAAARLLDQKAERYANRFGIDDVGGLSFGQGPHAEIKMDHYTSMIELADEVRAMLAARARMSVPEGWKLVPIVSTAEMDNAGADHCDGYWNTAQAVWDAMLAAAPEAKP